MLRPSAHLRASARRVARAMGASLAACASPSRVDGVAVTDVDVAVLDLKRAERRLDAHLRRVDADIARGGARAER